MFARFEKYSSILGLWRGRDEKRASGGTSFSSVISRETLATLNAAGTLDSTSFRGVETRPKLLTIRMRAPRLSFLLQRRVLSRGIEKRGFVRFLASKQDLFRSLTRLRYSYRTSKERCTIEISLFINRLPFIYTLETVVISLFTHTLMFISVV